MAAYSGEPLMVEAPELARRLRMAMKRQGLGSLRKLEAASGVNKTTIQRWLKGSPPHAEMSSVRKVAAALQTTPESLLDLPEPSQASPSPPPPRYPPELLKQIAAFDPETVSALEEALPLLRKIIEETRQGSGDSKSERN